MRRVIFPVFIFVFLLAPRFAGAEITHPYVVDEKPQVLFGDSIEVQVPNEDHTATTTYLGLENYKQDYVNGYAHFTFTYTHGIGYFAGYPPNVYVTDSDPVKNTAPLEKWFINPYGIFDWNSPTDWYLYDIQFDASGFTLDVKEAGNIEFYNRRVDIANFAETDYVALANAYPYASDIPGMLPYSMAFTPVPLLKNASPKINPVIIIPGIVGTELYDGSDLIWPDITQMFTDSDDKFLTDSLSLDVNGNSIKDISVGDVVKEILNLPVLGVNIFKNLENDLDNNGYILDKNLFFFPYDWRLDLNTTKDLLNQKIEEIKSETGSDKVDIVAHSMGGLLVKDYLNEYGEGNVDKLIFVGTPHLGAPKAGKVLLEGDNFAIPWLNPDSIKEVALNSPALHELLPSPVYFNVFQGYLKNYSLLGRSQLLNYEDTKNIFINNKNQNPLMFQYADNFYNKNLQNFDFSNIKTYNIVGCKTPTQTAYSFGIFGEIGQVGYSSGDGTIPLVSADYINIPAEDKFYVKNGNHAELPSTNGVKELILNILNDKQINLTSNISSDSSFCNFNGKLLAWHSPVDVNIYDSDGNHTGPIDDGIEYGIPGVDYEIIGHDKFMFLPTDEGQGYQIEAVGEEEGNFDLQVSDVQNGQYGTTQVFNDVPVNVSDMASFVVNQAERNESILLENKDGDFEVPSSAEIQGNAIQDLNPPETEIKTEIVRNNKTSKPNKGLQVTFAATDENSGVLETLYSLDNGDIFNEYTSPFVIDDKKTGTIMYYSIDKAGNDEEVKTFDIRENRPKKCKSWKCLDINKKHNVHKEYKKLSNKDKNIIKKFKKLILRHK